MRAAGLKAIDTVVTSTAVLVKSRNTTNSLVELIASRIQGVISEFYLTCCFRALDRLLTIYPTHSCPKVYFVPIQRPARETRKGV
jgi:ATP phosphoribosyltransferase